MSAETTHLCEAVADLAHRPLPPDVAEAARRSLLNVVGTAVGASRSAATDAVVREAVAHGGAAPRPVPVPGRAERLDPQRAALATGVAAHVDDFDDTHLPTVIHPGAAALAAGLAVAVPEQRDGAELLRAFALGCEVQLRLGNAVSPSHYDIGWHITGTCGVVGAAVTAGLLLGLDARGLEAAVGLATTATLGHRQAFGSMTKAFHPGKAAANGVLAARLARHGETAPEAALEGPGGFLEVLADATRPAELTEEMGTRWELCLNAFKPYPCGIVSHPVIDAALAAGERVDDVRRIRAIDVHCHPLVPELMGTIQPSDGLQARFSAAHTAAAALADGRLTLRQFDDERVVRDDVRRLRGLVAFRPDPGVARDEATLTVTLDGGGRVTEHVRHARGSLARPLTDAELDEKVTLLVEDVLPGRAPEVIAAARGVDAPGGLRRLLEAVAPADTPGGDAPRPVPPAPRAGAVPSAGAAADGAAPTAAVAAFAVTADVPGEHAAEAARLVLHVLDAAAGGAADPALRPLAAVAAESGGRSECPVPGTGDRAGAEWAAALTAAAARTAPAPVGAVPATDGAPPAYLVPAVAAAVATGVRRGASLEAVARAVARAAEVGRRLEEPLAGPLRERGWGLVGTLGRIAGAVACGALAGLDEAAMAHALGVAATQAAGIPTGPATRLPRTALAAADAVLSASLAAHGYTASAAALEGRRGLVRLLTPQAPPQTLEKLADRLGEGWAAAGGRAAEPPAGTAWSTPVEQLVPGPDGVRPAPGEAAC